MPFFRFVLRNRYTVITDEDVTEAVPQFNLIEEDDIDVNIEDEDMSMII